MSDISLSQVLTAKRSPRNWKENPRSARRRRKGQRCPAWGDRGRWRQTERQTAPDSCRRTPASRQASWNTSTQIPSGLLPLLVDRVKAKLRTTRHKQVMSEIFFPANLLAWILKKLNQTKLECGPMPNVIAALPNIGGALCSTPQSLADTYY